MIDTTEEDIKKIEIDFKKPETMLKVVSFLDNQINLLFSVLEVITEELEKKDIITHDEIKKRTTEKMNKKTMLVRKVIQDDHTKRVSIS
jgi:hypothetical protein